MHELQRLRVHCTWPEESGGTRDVEKANERRWQGKSVVVAGGVGAYAQATRLGGSVNV